MDELLRDYYKFLAVAAVDRQIASFGTTTEQGLNESGATSGGRLTRAIYVKLLDLLLNPMHTIGKVLRRMKAN
jgi:hypothetical protein